MEEPEDLNMEQAVEADSDDLQVLDTAPAIFQTPSKKRSLKMRERLEDKFCRRSTRLSAKKQGFKSAADAKKAQKEVPVSAFEPVPLAIIPAPAPTPAPAPAPYLTADVLEGIGTGFLQIQPESVSAALLLNDVDDD